MQTSTARAVIDSNASLGMLFLTRNTQHPHSSFRVFVFTQIKQICIEINTPAQQTCQNAEYRIRTSEAHGIEKVSEFSDLVKFWLVSHCFIFLWTAVCRNFVKCHNYLVLLRFVCFHKNRQYCLPGHHFEKISFQPDVQCY